MALVQRQKEKAELAPLPIVECLYKRDGPSTEEHDVQIPDYDFKLTCFLSPDIIVPDAYLSLCSSIPSALLQC